MKKSIPTLVITTAALFASSAFVSAIEPITEANYGQQNHGYNDYGHNGHGHNDYGHNGYGHGHNDYGHNDYGHNDYGHNDYGHNVHQEQPYVIDRTKTRNYTERYTIGRTLSGGFIYKWVTVVEYLVYYSNGHRETEISRTTSFTSPPANSTCSQ